MSPENAHVSRDLRSSERELARTQQEVNGELVLSSLRAHEETEAAEVREKALLETAELRERLLGVLGHDLRTPLCAMIMAVDCLARRSNLSKDDLLIAERALRSGRRMDRMITQILDFTRVRLGGGLLLTLKPDSDLGRVCQTVADELTLGTSVSVKCSGEGNVTGSWDVDRLAEVISNIARNAVEHAREGTSIAIGAHDDGPRVVVVITNEGESIPPDVLPFIFEPFRRAKQHQNAKAGNLGLGLYIAYEITRAHGGTIDVRSADGRTTFTLRLPRCPPASSSEFEGEQKRSAPAAC